MIMKDERTIVFLMDSYKTLNLQTDTSLLLMEVLIERGHRVLWLEPAQLTLQHDSVMGEVRAVRSVAPFELAPMFALALDQCDGLLVRIDPPVDSYYFHITYILDYLCSSVVQFNDTAALRNFNEKVLPLRWPELAPPSLVTSDSAKLLSFREKHQDIVVKPLDDCSGRGVTRYQQVDDLALDNLTAEVLDTHQKPRFVMAQRFLPAVSQGDKRVFLLRGEVIGYVNRVPRQGQFLANIHQGALCEATELSEKEVAAIDKIVPFLRENGLFFVGVDFIGGFLTEVNLTSPSAIRQINQVMGEDVHLYMVDRILSEIAEQNAGPSMPLWTCCVKSVA